jgi:hypothetical protein
MYGVDLHPVVVRFTADIKHFWTLLKAEKVSSFWREIFFFKI